MKTLQEALSKSMIKKLEKHNTFSEEYYVVEPFGTLQEKFNKKYKNTIIDNHYVYLYLIRKDEMKEYMNPNHWHHLRIYELKKEYKSFDELKKDFDIDSALRDLPIKQIWPN